MKTKIIYLQKKKLSDYFNRLTILLMLACLLASASQTHAQDWNQLQKIVASDKAGGDLFGCAVSISGDYAIVGARQVFDDASGNNTNLVPFAGAAYFFERDGSGTWQEVQKIVASDRDTSDLFGSSVAISGDYAIVAAPMHVYDVSGNNELFDAGAAYIFERDGSGNWIEVQKIVASDRDSLDNFGYSVSISGNYIIVGVKDDDEDANGGNALGNAGSAYIFERDGSGNWQEVQKIVASDREAGDRFGVSVSISGNYAIVGADQEDEDAKGHRTKNNSGSAYVFERDGSGNWQEVDKIVASDRDATDLFGFSVSISGTQALVGARSDSHSAGGNAGSAYIFERNGNGSWKQEQKITASDAAPSDWFGYSVSISGTHVLVSARSEDEDASGNNTLPTAGSAYVFEEDGSGTWQEVEKIVASDRAANDQFGYRVSISGDYALVGAILKGGYNAGAAYIYSRTNGCPDSDGDGVCDADDICPGYDDNIDSDGDGIPDGCDNCTSVSNTFPDDPLTHSGTGASSTSYNFGAPGNTDVSFVVSGLDAKPNGNPNNRYIELLTVTYTDAGGTWTYGTFSGENTSSVNVDIAGPVYSVTLTLEDAYDGDPPGTLSVDPGSISSCPPSGALLETNDVPWDKLDRDNLDLTVYPNPASEQINFRLRGIDDAASLTIHDHLGRILWTKQVQAGQRTLQLDLENSAFPDGMYLVSLVSQGERITKHLVVLK